MSYLYGDSTPSALETNYIEFLRDAVDFCVQVLLADQRVAEAQARIIALDRSTAAEIDRLQQLTATVGKAMAGLPPGAPESASVRCAAAIARSTDGLVRAEVAAVQATLESEQQKRNAQAASEREGCVNELERLLVKHDLPDMTMHTQVGLTAGGRYQCRGRLTTGFGLAATLELEVPSGHLYAQLLRVDRLFERLEVQMPEMAGWLHKEMRLKPQHLEKHYLVALSLADGEGLLKLRAANDGSGAGFDALVRHEGPRVSVLRVDEHGKPAGEPFEVQDADAARLLALHDKVAAAAAELGRYRRAIVDATLDGEPLRVSNRSTMLVERLIATMAPVVQEIAARSQSPGELVLRRLLADDRREEVFLSKSELRRKLEPLPEGERALFDPLLVDIHPRKQFAPFADKPPVAEMLAPPARPSRAATQLPGVTAPSATPALPIPTGSVIPPPPAEPPPAALKPRLFTARPRRDTPTNPGPAVAPVLPSPDEPPVLLEPRSKTSTTPPAGMPIEALPSSAAPAGPAADADQTLREIGSDANKQAS